MKKKGYISCPRRPSYLLFSYKNVVFIKRKVIYVDGFLPQTNSSRNTRSELFFHSDSDFAVKLLLLRFVIRT